MVQGTYKEYIERLKKQWVGKTVMYENEEYKVVDVDYNGLLLIDKKARWTDTTAVSTTSVQEITDKEAREWGIGKRKT